jgi:thioredoxin
MVDLAGMVEKYGPIPDRTRIVAPGFGSDGARLLHFFPRGRSRRAVPRVPMSEIVQATDQSFDSEVLASAGPVLVDFSAVWCGPCKKLEPVVDEIAAEYGGRLKVVKVDVDHSPSTAAKFGVLSVPTLMLFRGGQVRDQFIGVLSKKALADRVDKVL